MELIRCNYPATKQIFTASQTGIKCLSMEVAIKDCKVESEKNSEPKRARVSQRVAVKASGSQSGSRREPKTARERQGEIQ